jgi:hypothetical protein
LTGIRKQLNKEENKRFANLRREIEESRAFRAAQEAGPVEEPNSSSNHLVAKLQKLLNNNRPRQQPNKPSTNNLIARLAALRND